MRIRLPRAALWVLAPVTAVAVVGTTLVGAASGDSPQHGTTGGPLRPVGDDASFTTVLPSPDGIEGLTGDGHGNLYVAARGTGSCAITRVPVTGGTAALVGSIAAPCGPAGLTFDSVGRLYVADSGRVMVLRPNADTPPVATVFAEGVPGANGLAFDRRGALWVSDGTTGQGRVWRIGPDGGAPTEMFRVQPMVNEVNVVDGVGGIGRDPRSLPPGSVTITPGGRAAADTAGSQHLVANGLAFTADGGTLYVADTGRGAIWQVELGRDGSVRSPMGCDTTFSANTLCLDDVFVAHPYLEGADGIVLDRAGNIWVASNERNAVVVVTVAGRVMEYYRSPADATTRLRNNGPLEFPTSPFIDGRTLCLTQSDGSRRDNFPSTGGEATPAGPARAKVSCLDQHLPVPGLPLPIG